MGKINNLNLEERNRVSEIESFHGKLFLCLNRMWREIKLLAASKPVVASMADVAASGGYYMAMAAETIVAENLTITGSIGVVTGEAL